MNGLRNIAMCIGLMFTVAGCHPADDTRIDELNWIDLSHTYDEQTLYWPTAKPFSLETVAKGRTDGGFYYSAFNFQSSEHGGTHLDAPVHFFEGGDEAHQVALQRLIGPAIVVDVSANTVGNPDYLISRADLLAWEAEHGTIRNNPIVLFNTGWGRFWPDAEAYLGTSERGSTAVPDLHFPGISAEAALFLSQEREIRAVGIDTPSLDFGQSRGFLAHRILFAKNIPGFENVANVDQLPPTGSLVFALPMKIRGGSGGPVRIVAGVAN
ncbi:MAG: cyclase family protein [Pseudomonadota bacterium]